MDLTDYRNREIEIARVADLMNLVPNSIASVLDVGARDGYISKKLADKGFRVVALDLDTPKIDDPRITCVKGDATALQFTSQYFDMVFVAEVLEHIPCDRLALACRELGRVAEHFVVVGVPYKQDIRIGRTTCGTCCKFNPPWGHVNSFDERSIMELFPDFKEAKRSFVGLGKLPTNALSTWWLDLAGNPYGTYMQDEPCIHCGKALTRPPPRTFGQKVLTKGASLIGRLQKPFLRRHPNWIHMLLARA